MKIILQNSGVISEFQFNVKCDGYYSTMPEMFTILVFKFKEMYIHLSHNVLEFREYSLTQQSMY